MIYAWCVDTCTEEEGGWERDGGREEKREKDVSKMQYSIKHKV